MASVHHPARALAEGAHAAAPIDTRVGQIVEGDNRFLGRSVFEEWSHALTSQADGLLAAVGVHELSPVNRESLRLLVLCTLSPDARVWPLKLTRLIASHGDAAIGYFGGQLVSTGKIMGPGAVTQAARGLRWITAEVGDEPSDAAVAEAVKAWLVRCGGRFGGFGVPFRDEDERRVGLLRLTEGGPIEQRRHWRLHEQVVAALAPLRPNCAISFAAMMLDMGVEPEHCGLFLSVSMSQMFLAHAIEASISDGARAHTIATGSIDYQGTSPRHTQAPGAPAVLAPALRRSAPRADDRDP